MEPTTKRRRSRGSAWYWKQTDTWYYTVPSTKKRVRLFGLDGLPIRGIAGKQDAELALARIRAAGKWRANTPLETSDGPWVVAKVCSEYIATCEQRLGQGAVSQEYVKGVCYHLNAFASYCGAVPVSELKKGHLEQWLASQTTWRSTATQRNAVTAVLSAFLHCEENFELRNPLKGFRKPAQRPRLHSLSVKDEKALYEVAEVHFKDFLFAALNTGLRPFCELARLAPSMVIKSPRGMLWKVYSSKTDKTRVIPVRQEVAELTQRLLKRTGDGPIFCNRHGNPWKKPTAGGMFREARQTLGWNADPVKSRYSCYSCRHTFAHRMLSGFWNGGQGCSIEVLAELMGDTPKVAFDHYGREWGQNYQEPLWAAIGVDVAKQSLKTRHIRSAL